MGKLTKRYHSSYYQYAVAGISTTGPKSCQSNLIHKLIQANLALSSFQDSRIRCRQINNIMVKIILRTEDNSFRIQCSVLKTVLLLIIDYFVHIVIFMGSYLIGSHTIYSYFFSIVIV